MAARRARLEQELACDEAVCRQGLALGFDGSVGGPKRDTTALVAASGNNVWVVGYWEAPAGAPKDWRVPRREVIATIDHSSIMPEAVTMNGGVALVIDVDPHSVERRLATHYLDEAATDLDDAIARR